MREAERVPHYVLRRQIDDTAPPGEYDFRRGFIRSSNTYFITNGMRAGIETVKQLDAPVPDFGFVCSPLVEGDVLAIWPPIAGG